MRHLSAGTPTALSRTLIWREVAVPILAAAAAMSAAVVGAALVKDSSGADGVNNFVLALSGIYSEYFTGFAESSRFGFAFQAGIVSSFSPCGLLLLFAYPWLYLGTGEYEVEASLTERLGRALRRALVVGGAFIVGLVVLLGVAGAISETGALSLMADALPWLALAIGVVLTLAAGWLLTRSKLYTALARRAVVRIGNPSQNNITGYFLFGLAYAAVSLSCTLPMFLAVIGTRFEFGQFVLHTMGMATFMILATLEMALIVVGLTLAIALLKAVMADGLRSALPSINVVRTVLMTVYEAVGILWMMLAGGYIIFFWLTIGGLIL
jgi:cytochrome c biogenesis protein CcdA